MDRKGLEMPLNAVVVIVLAVIVLLGIMVLQEDFLGKLQNFVMPKINSGVSP